MLARESKTKIPEYKGIMGRKAAASGILQPAKSLSVSASEQTSNKKAIIKSPHKVTSTYQSPSISMPYPGCASAPVSPLASTRTPTIQKIRKTRMSSLPSSKLGVGKWKGTINNIPGHSKIQSPPMSTASSKNGNLDVLLPPRVPSLCKNCASTLPFQDFSADSEHSSITSARPSVEATIPTTILSAARIDILCEEPFATNSHEPIHDVINKSAFTPMDSLQEKADFELNENTTTSLKDKSIPLKKITEVSEIWKTDEFQSTTEVQDVCNTVHWNQISNECREEIVKKYEDSFMKEQEMSFTSCMEVLTEAGEGLHMEKQCFLNQPKKYQDVHSGREDLFPKTACLMIGGDNLKETAVIGESDMEYKIQEEEIKLSMASEFNKFEQVTFKHENDKIHCVLPCSSEEARIRRRKLELQEKLLELELNSSSPRLLMSRKILFIPTVHDRGIFTSSLTIRNPSDELMAYKIVTCKKNRYKAKPCVGYIRSKDNIKVTIMAYMGSNFTEKVKGRRELMILGAQAYQEYEMDADEYIKTVQKSRRNILQLHKIDKIHWFTPKKINIPNSDFGKGENVSEEMDNSEIQEKTKGKYEKKVSELNQEMNEIYNELSGIERYMIYLKGAAYGVMGSTVLAVGSIVCFHGIGSIHQCQDIPPPSSGWLDWFNL